MKANGAASVQAINNSDALDLAEYSTVESFMQKVFRKDATTDAQLTAWASASPQIDEFDRTGSLIENASKAIEALSSRCEILQLELDQEKGVSSDQADSIEALKRMVLDVKARATAFENDLKAMAVRCQASEARVVELEQNEKAVTLRAKKAEGMSNRLQQQVEAAFGQGSPIYSVMGSVGLKQAAE